MAVSPRSMAQQCMVSSIQKTLHVVTESRHRRPYDGAPGTIGNTHGCGACVGEGRARARDQPLCILGGRADGGPVVWAVEARGKVVEPVVVDLYTTFGIQSVDIDP